MQLVTSRMGQAVLVLARAALAATLVLVTLTGGFAEAHDGRQAEKLSRRMRPDGTGPLDRTRNECIEALMGQSVIDLRPGDFNSFAFTAKGIERITKAMDDLKVTSNNFRNTFEGLGGILEMDLLTAAGRQNALLLGPGGGAKSGHLGWLFPNMWFAQVNELMTQVELFGGQTEEGLKAGQVDVNTTGMAMHSKIVGLDEVNNGNPQLFAATMSFLNPSERTYAFGGVKYVADTIAVFSTGNATRAELMKSFADRGMQSGAAYLNRYAHKAWAHNWLTEDEQARMDKVNRMRNHLQSVVLYGSPEQAKDAREKLKNLQGRDIDWDIVRAFAEHAFVFSEDLEVALRGFTNKFREEMNKSTKDSDKAHRENPQTNPLVKTPANDWTERLRQYLEPDIKISAALDWLRLHSAEDVRGLKAPIVLGPLSLWRAMYMATTVGMGENRFNPRTLMVEFNLTKNGMGALVPLDLQRIVDQSPTVTDEHELLLMKEEQQLFNEIMSNILKTMAASSKSVAAALNPNPSAASLLNESLDFELDVARHRASGFNTVN